MSTEPEPLRELHRWLTDQIQCTEWALTLTDEGAEVEGARGQRWHRQRGYLAGLREARDALRAAVRKMEFHSEREAALNLRRGILYSVTYRRDHGGRGELLGLFDRTDKDGAFLFDVEQGRTVGIPAAMLYSAEEVK